MRQPLRSAASPRLLSCCVVVLAAALAGGCMRGSSGAAEGDLITGPAYPSDRQQARVVDIQVTRADTDIALTNTTAADIPACTLWINRRFSVPLAPLPIGASRRIDLRDCKDQYGERFRGGGFFAIEAPDRVVLAQLDVGGELVGLIVIGGQP